MESIGQLLKILRKKQGLTQKELSREICSQSVLSRIENDEEIPNIIVTQQLCQRLGIKVDQLLSERSAGRNERQFCRLFFYLRQQQFIQLEEQLNQLIPCVYLVSERKKLAFFQAVCAFYCQKDPQKALAITQTALALTAEQKSLAVSDSQILLLMWAGKMCVQLAEPALAEKFFQQAYFLFQTQAECSERIELMLLFVNYGNFLVKAGRLTEAAQVIACGLSFSQRVQTYYQVNELNVLQQKLQKPAET
ncbi:helix-turn-helix domain-containing protein [Enterococcus sp. CSURQ0835]|uniref:helix-turn-helix domain-containing protein n=1 Tax=Enterococcus sp. CSURQ0835 TaxID=2681394 RepID=UPI001357C6FA|nr:helix-turn-helix transcriptional regulator [Enterococcus sp. CSURQ0835]